MQNRKLLSRLFPSQQISALRFQQTVALCSLCLLPLLNGCTTTRTVYVQTPQVLIPANLTAETQQPAIPDPMTWGSSLDLNVALFSALGQCNRDKADIRAIEAQRK